MVSPCYGANVPSYGELLNHENKILKKVSSGDLVGTLLEGLAFLGALPESFKDCILSNPDVKELGTKFPKELDVPHIISWLLSHASHAMDIME